MQALDDVVVLDLTQHIAGPYATKLMADYGADVIKVERPGSGDIARSFGPFQGPDAHPEKSGLFFFLNTNKRSVALDLKSADGRAALASLVSRPYFSSMRSLPTRPCPPSIFFRMAFKECSVALKLLPNRSLSGL